MEKEQERPLVVVDSEVKKMENEVLIDEYIKTMSRLFSLEAEINRRGLNIKLNENDD